MGPFSASSYRSIAQSIRVLLPEFSLKDRVYVVTGGARGLGLTQVEAILEAGGRVYALDRLQQPRPDFERIAARAKDELGTHLEFIPSDVRDQDAMHAIAEDIVRKEKRIDGLIAAAGIQHTDTALEYRKEDADRLFEVNITGVFMSAQAVAKQMVKLGTPGSLVLIASMSGTIANKGLICAPYNASKAGVVQLARNLAVEWGQYGIRVNTISPGYILTDMVEAEFAEHPELRKEWASHNPLGRISKAPEYRGAAVFLLSDASSFMTGADMIIDGGHRAW
ncbi:NAD(P)-binding protein [Auricularia subglabra TFB-10046 SS5]|uniref:NAD(P)-binding protein n=1 Tax=Auricularia subglabra (strain TFB-10046 / SS5) TaxID=717982 RepID=J0LFI0_AURST|nr:NAD(P)-binding protein [Auricularia subglabra TFB-10046 SS5]